MTNKETEIIDVGAGECEICHMRPVVFGALLNYRFKTLDKLFVRCCGDCKKEFLLKSLDMAKKQKESES